MSYTSTYLNFSNQTEQAFEFYRSIFGWEFEWGIHRFGEMPVEPGRVALDDVTKKFVMHVVLPILGGHKLMGTDAPASMGFTVNPWSNVYISLHPDTLEEAQRLGLRMKIKNEEL